MTKLDYTHLKTDAFYQPKKKKKQAKNNSECLNCINERSFLKKEIIVSIV